MTKTLDPELDQAQAFLDELRRYEDGVRAEFEVALQGEASRQEARGRWPFRGAWHTEREIRRLRRQAWFRWVVVRLEILALIALTLYLAIFVVGILVWLYPK